MQDEAAQMRRTFPVDIDPEQVVRWATAENRIVPNALRFSVWLSVETRAIPIRRELHLGDEEREDLSETTTVATLEIVPAHAHEGWTLKVIVEDEAGPRPPEGETAIAGGRKIDLGVFYKEFIRPGRGTASVVAEAEDSAAEARVSRLLKVIERGLRPPGRRRAGN